MGCLLDSFLSITWEILCADVQALNVTVVLGIVRLHHH